MPGKEFGTHIRTCREGDCEEICQDCPKHFGGFVRIKTNSCDKGDPRVEVESMSSVRILVGTRKGAFILIADGARKRWKVSGPHFAGWEIYHMKGSPVAPDRIYASQTSGWFGQIIQRSDDGGKTWNTPGSGP